MSCSALIRGIRPDLWLAFVLWKRMRSGDRPGLQNRRAAGQPVTGGFDPHSLPPIYFRVVSGRIQSHSETSGHSGCCDKNVLNISRDSHRSLLRILPTQSEKNQLPTHLEAVYHEPKPIHPTDRDTWVASTSRRHGSSQTRHTEPRAMVPGKPHLASGGHAGGASFLSKRVHKSTECLHL